MYNGMEELKYIIGKAYKDWCIETKRSGDVLKGSSIQEFIEVIVNLIAHEMEKDKEKIRELKKEVKALEAGMRGGYSYADYERMDDNK